MSGTERKKQRCFRRVGVQVFGSMNETSVFQLPPIERAGHYRKFAGHMRSCAASALSKEIRMGYLDMAVQWLDMADKLEAEFGKVSIAVEAPELASLLRRSSS